MEANMTIGRENNKWNRKQQVEEKITNGSENDKQKRK